MSSAARTFWAPWYLFLSTVESRPIVISHPTTTYEVLTSFELRLTLTRLGHFVAKVASISTDLPRRAASQNRNDFNVTIPVLSLVESTSFGVQYKPQGLFDAVKLVHTHPSSTTATRSTCEGLGLGSVIRYHNGEFNLVHPGLAEVTAKSFQYSHGDATCVGFGLGWGLGWLGYHRRVQFGSGTPKLERRNYLQGPRRWPSSSTFMSIPRDQCYTAQSYL
ncbi:hypothetical protein C8R47DRAFT_1215067 [Mycena vitilis]|nr:hypothetical protein C8R47DRAFT_1215067 [Mycena vitilis]